MIKKIKQYLKKNKELKAELLAMCNNYTQLCEHYEILKGNLPTAQEVIKEILKKDIGWYDYNDLDEQKRKEYFDEAQRILESKVFQNELNAYISDTIKHIAKQSRDFKEVTDLRMSINGLEAFRERLEDISNPEATKPTEENLHDNI